MLSFEARVPVGGFDCPEVRDWVSGSRLGEGRTLWGAGNSLPRPPVVKRNPFRWGALANVGRTGENNGFGGGPGPGREKESRADNCSRESGKIKKKKKRR